MTYSCYGRTKTKNWKSSWFSWIRAPKNPVHHRKLNNGKSPFLHELLTRANTGYNSRFIERQQKPVDTSTPNHIRTTKIKSSYSTQAYIVYYERDAKNHIWKTQLENICAQNSWQFLVIISVVNFTYSFESTILRLSNIFLDSVVF